MKVELVHTNQHAKSYSIENLGVKKRIAFDIVLDHYILVVEQLLMIIQGTEGIGNSYLIRAIKNVLEA